MFCIDWADVEPVFLPFPDEARKTYRIATGMHETIFLTASSDRSAPLRGGPPHASEGGENDG